MEMKHDYLLVEMDLTHNKEFTLSDGTVLIRPDDWLVDESISEGQVFASNLDMRDVNPQIATVIATNKTSFIQPGERVFVHFNCIDNGQPVDCNGKEYLAIHLWQVYFVIRGVKDYRMMPTNYLGEQVFAEQERTASGIYLSSGNKREVMQVRITHVPEENAVCKVGDIAMSIDDYQYQLKHDGINYIKLRDYEITGTIVNNQFIQK